MLSYKQAVIRNGNSSEVMYLTFLVSCYIIIFVLMVYFKKGLSLASSVTATFIINMQNAIHAANQW